MGQRQRYRVIDLERLCWRLQAGDLTQVRKNLVAGLADRIAREQVKREPKWTESLAVGSRRFVEKIQPLILSRRETEIVATNSDSLRVLQEAATPYGQETGLKSAAKLQN